MDTFISLLILEMAELGISTPRRRVQVQYSDDASRFRGKPCVFSFVRIQYCQVRKPTRRAATSNQFRTVLFITVSYRIVSYRVAFSPPPPPPPPNNFLKLHVNH